MLLVYLLILVLLIANLSNFVDIFGLKLINEEETSSKYISLGTFVEPVIRVFNAIKYRKFNESYNIL